MISFPDQSKAFTYGVEYGRILEKMERGDEVVMITLNLKRKQ